MKLEGLSSNHTLRHPDEDLHVMSADESALNGQLTRACMRHLDGLRVCRSLTHCSTTCNDLRRTLVHSLL